jgi:hypothetical protein
MVLTTHAAAGAAIALAFRDNPWAGLFLALVSHFALDAVPHWHYPTKRLKRELKNLTGARPELDKGVLKDLAAIGLDFTIGVGIVAAAGLQFAPENLLLILAGAVLGTIPDFFQLLYYLFPVFPFVQIQRFHLRVHTKERLDDRPLWGIGTQAAIIIACLWLIKFFV